MRRLALMRKESSLSAKMTEERIVADTVLAEIARKYLLAVAKVCTAKVLTGDEHFKGLRETIWIGQNQL